MLLQRVEKLEDALAAAAVDEAERTIRQRHAVARINCIEELGAALPQRRIGLGEHGLVVPHRVVLNALLQALEIEVGDPAARSRGSAHTGEQRAHLVAHVGPIEIRERDRVGVAQRRRQHRDISAGAGIGLGGRARQERQPLGAHRLDDVARRHVAPDPAELLRLAPPYPEQHRRPRDRGQVADPFLAIEQVDPDAVGGPHRIEAAAVLGDGDADIERAHVIELAGEVLRLAELLHDRLENAVL